MEKKHSRHGFTVLLLFAVVALLSVVSVASCIAAEIKKAKEEQLKLDGKLCYLPGSDAFKYGVVALVSLATAQILGNSVMCICLWSRKKGRRCKGKKLTIAAALLVVSWTSFAAAMILLAAATSMNREQRYGTGWLDGECYVVKNGVYTASAVLVLIAIGCTIYSATEFTRKDKIERNEKLQAQLQVG